MSRGGAPSLVDCASLRIEGDVRFGANVTCRGHVHLRAEDGILEVKDNSVLEEK